MALGRGLATPLVLSKVRSWCSVPERSFQGFLSRRFFALTVLTHISDTRPSCPTLQGEPQGPATPVLLLDRPPLPSWKAGGAAASGAEGRAVEGARAQGACSGRAAVLCLRAGHGEKGCCGHLLVSYHGDQGALEFASVGQR